MKTKVKATKEIELEKIIIDIHIRHVGDTEDYDVPTNFPLLNGNQWKAEVMIDSGQIVGWPQGVEQEMFCKVCDAGVYTLIDNEGNNIAQIDGYVPNEIVPGEYGDYVDLKISGDGIITNWPKHPCVDEFFEDDD